MAGSRVELGNSGYTRHMDELEAIGAASDAEIDLAETALLLAAIDRPDEPLAPYRAHLAELAQAANAVTRYSDSVGVQADALRSTVAVQFGYRGDSETYDDARNANLLSVIDRRRGLPVALGILYIHAARAYGSDVAGLNFPSHFVVRIEARGQRLVFDPFDEFAPMDAAALRRRLKELHGDDAELEAAFHAPVGNRDILVRLQNNLKVRAVTAGDLLRAIEVLETMVHIAPKRPELWWEKALLHYQVGGVKTAIATLEAFLDAAAPGAQHPQMEDLLRQLRGTMN